MKAIEQFFPVLFVLFKMVQILGSVNKILMWPLQ